MTEPDRLTSADLLRNAARELESMDRVVRSLERLVCDLLAREPAMTARRNREVRAFDLLSQRLRGLSSCLVAAAATPGPADLPVRDLARTFRWPRNAARSSALRSRTDLCPKACLGARAALDADGRASLLRNAEARASAVDRWIEERAQDGAHLAADPRLIGMLAPPSVQPSDSAAPLVGLAPKGRSGAAAEPPQSALDLPEQIPAAEEVLLLTTKGIVAQSSADSSAEERPVDRRALPQALSSALD